jgi:hypothetical protein
MPFRSDVIPIKDKTDNHAKDTKSPANNIRHMVAVTLGKSALTICWKKRSI